MSTPEQEFMQRVDQSLREVQNRLDLTDKRIDTVVARSEERMNSLGRRIEVVQESDHERWRDFRREREATEAWLIKTGLNVAAVATVFAIGICIGGAIQSASQPEPTTAEATQ